MKTGVSKEAMLKLEAQLRGATVKVLSEEKIAQAEKAKAKAAKRHIKEARKAFKLAKKQARKTAKRCRQAKKELAALVDKAAKLRRHLASAARRTAKRLSKKGKASGKATPSPAPTVRRQGPARKPLPQPVAVTALEPAPQGRLNSPTNPQAANGDDGQT